LSEIRNTPKNRWFIRKKKEQKKEEEEKTEKKGSAITLDFV
jgi:hypothetical protein